MEADYIKPDQQIKVQVYNPEGQEIYTFESAGLHNIQEAITLAYGQSGLTDNSQTLVYRVTNMATGVSHRYRLNADGNAKLIVE